MARQKAEIEAYIVYKWMWQELGLKGSKKEVYAIIYNQSQGGDYFRGSTQAIADNIGLSKRQVITILRELVDEGLLIKKEKIKNKLKYCEYRAIRKSGEKTSPVSKSGEKTSPVSKKSGEKTSPVLAQSGEEISPPLYIYNNNIYNNNLLSKKVREDEKPKSKRKTFDDILEEEVPNERVRSSLKDYIQMRALNNKKMTNRALQLIIKDLNILASDPKDQVRIIERSVKNSWPELYPLPEPKQTKLPAEDKTNKPGFTNFRQRDTDMTELERVMFKT